MCIQFTAYEENREANIFVAILPASNYPFVYAYENTRKRQKAVNVKSLALDS